VFEKFFYVWNKKKKKTSQRKVRDSIFHFHITFSSPFSIFSICMLFLVAHLTIKTLTSLGFRGGLWKGGTLESEMAIRYATMGFSILGSYMPLGTWKQGITYYIIVINLHKSLGLFVCLFVSVSVSIGCCLLFLYCCLLFCSLFLLIVFSPLFCFWGLPWAGLFGLVFSYFVIW
jgi:hypothetical protein